MHTLPTLGPVCGNCIAEIFRLVKPKVSKYPKVEKPNVLCWLVHLIVVLFYEISKTI